MTSWYDAWADRYEDLSKPQEATDVAFYVGLARESDGPLVELAVGTGRVAIPARATGRRVIGIDSSSGMLEQARVRAAEAGVELDLREGDMRELELEEPAALIYCPGRSLLHLPTWADRRRCFERVAASLVPDGRFAWNAFALDHHVAAAIDGQHADPEPGLPLPHTVTYSVGDNRVDVRRCRDRLAVVGDEERVARAARRRRPAPRGALWRVRRGTARRRQPRVRLRGASASVLASARDSRPPCGRARRRG